MIQKHSMPGWFWATTHCLVFLLLCIWQVPGTIALRFGLLGVLLLLPLMLFFWGKPQKAHQPKYVTPIICLLLLTLWMMLVITFWGVDPDLSWKEFRSQWLMPLGASFLGALLARAATRDSDRQTQGLVMTVFWALLLQVLLHDVLDLAYWLKTGVVPFRQAPVLYLPTIIQDVWGGAAFLVAFTGKHGEKFSYVNNVLAAFVVAEVVQRLALGKRWLSINWPVLGLAIVAILLCSYLLQYRNGNVGLLLLLGFAAMMVLIRMYQMRRLSMGHIVAIATLVLVCFSTLSWALYKSDSRWKTLIDTVPIALNTERHIAWRGLDLEPLPQLVDGTPVDLSNYERLAWMKEGSKLVLDHPMGTGHNRNAYGDGIDSKYHMNGTRRGSHSHSGLIDFTVANGIPGLMLWLAFLGSVFYVGWTAFKRGQMAPGLLLMFMVSGFFSRSVVDSNIRDHMLQQFMFLVMLFAIIASKTPDKRDLT